MMLSAPAGGQLDRRRIAVKRSFALGSTTGSRSARLEPAQPPSPSDERPPSNSKPAAAAIHELLNQLLLRRGEIVGFHRADDERLIGEQILRAGRETFGQLLRILDALAIDFVFGGPQHRDELHDAVVLFRAPDEFVFPARLAFDVQHAALVRFDVHQARDGIVVAIFLARQRIDRKLERLGAGVARR